MMQKVKSCGLSFWLLVIAGVTISLGSADAKEIAKPTQKPVIAATVLPLPNGLVPDMMLGSPYAKVTVIEYASTSCPHCGAWHRDIFPYIEQTYIKTGKVRFIFREVMTSPQQYAMSSYLIGRCLVAKNSNKTDAAPYFTVIDTFFDEQDAFFKSGRVTSVLAAVSARTGQSQETLRACISDPDAMTSISNSIYTHLDVDNVEQTPTFFIDGKRLEGSDKSDFDKAIAAAMKGQ